MILREHQKDLKTESKSIRSSYKMAFEELQDLYDFYPEECINSTEAKKLFEESVSYRKKIQNLLNGFKKTSKQIDDVLNKYSSR